MGSLSRGCETAYQWLRLAVGCLPQVLKLMKRREKWLVLVALRFLRTCIGLKASTRPPCNRCNVNVNLFSFVSCIYMCICLLKLCLQRLSYATTESSKENPFIERGALSRLSLMASRDLNSRVQRPGNPASPRYELLSKPPLNFQV